MTHVPSLSSVFSELNRRYKNEGLEILGGFCPFLTGAVLPMGTYIARNKTFLSTSGGISDDEATIMHSLCEQIKPKNILIIGNSYGFSTVFLALANPDAKLVAFDKFRTEGIKVTNKLLSGLNGKDVIQGSTPDDIPSIIEAKLDGTVDLVLIDAVHTNDIQTEEFEVLNSYLSEKAIVIFHDVISCDLLDSFEFLKKKYNSYEFRLITKSTSGIGVCIKGDIDAELNNYLDYISVDVEKIFKFNTLMMKFGKPASDIFNECETEYELLPHPQL